VNETKERATLKRKWKNNNGETHLLGTLVKILRLERSSRALIGLELVEENGVVLSVAHVLREVVYSVQPKQRT